MKTAFFPIIITMIVAFSSCSTIYKTEQTPDDLYYSPTKELPKEDVAKNEDRNARYDEYISSSDDRYLRMKVANRYQWEGLDDYSYWNDSRYDFYGYNYYNNAYGYNYGGYYPGLSFGFSNFYGYSPYSSYYGYGNGFSNSYYGYGGYGSYYNPYYSLAYYKNTSAPRGYTSGSNLSAYRNRNYNNYNLPNLPPSAQPRRDNSNSLSNLIRRVVAPPAGSSSSTPSTTVDRPARTFTPSTTPTSNTGGSSGGFGSSGSSSSAPRKPRG